MDLDLETDSRIGSECLKLLSIEKFYLDNSPKAVLFGGLGYIV